MCAKRRKKRKRRKYKRIYENKEDFTYLTTELWIIETHFSWEPEN
jgi:hypothetical protein